jgi:hypothetical protein
MPYVVQAVAKVLVVGPALRLKALVRGQRDLEPEERVSPFKALDGLAQVMVCQTHGAHLVAILAELVDTA